MQQINRYLVLAIFLFSTNVESNPLCQLALIHMTKAKNSTERVDAVIEAVLTVGAYILANNDKSTLYQKLLYKPHHPTRVLQILEGHPLWGVTIPTNPELTPWALLSASERKLLIKELTFRIQIGTYDKEEIRIDGQVGHKNLQDLLFPPPSSPPIPLTIRQRLLYYSLLPVTSGIFALSAVGGRQLLVSLTKFDQLNKIELEIAKNPVARDELQLLSPSAYLINAQLGNLSGDCKFSAQGLCALFSELGAPPSAFRLYTGYGLRRGGHAWVRYKGDGFWGEDVDAILRSFIGGDGRRFPLAIKFPWNFSSVPFLKPVFEIK
ncbi:MAG: hypothetical protein JWQ35_1588 [Bacteriovoracaceae bacterium]|nr:hypothetical protein [Bacteriovoracaceae bacterium]